MTHTGFVFILLLSMAAFTRAAEAPSSLNARGLAQQSSGNYEAASDSFSAAADAAGSPEERLTYLLNASRALIDSGRISAATLQLDQAQAALSLLSSPSARMHLALADQYRALVYEWGESAEYRARAFAVLDDGLEQSQGRASPELAWLYGYQGLLYEDVGQYREAIQQTHLALTVARQFPTEAQLYRWEWQLGRNLAATDQHAAALDAYRRASVNLDPLRPQIQESAGGFVEVLRPFYYQYADLLLKDAVGSSPESRPEKLAQAQAALEALKTAEVEDFFGQRCVADQQVEPPAIAGETAVLYPVMLPDRLELLFQSGNRFFQYSVPVGASELTRTLREFRLNLEVDAATPDYLRLAQQLHDWLILPLAPSLEMLELSTLVIVPDAALRTVPFAALHDGESFLIERYSISTVPALELLRGGATAVADSQAFAGGLSEAVQGFPALPSVTAELDEINRLVDANVVQDVEFSTARLNQELQQGQYDVVHLATHGKFERSYSESFLLTHDSRLSMNQLGDLLAARSEKGEELDLLVLSACETAAGDDRAALGVAGLAVRSGARSAVASLWEVDDAATGELMRLFYQALFAESAGTAGSLQQAQKQMIASADFAHPSYWSAFMVIGDWQ